MTDKRMTDERLAEIEHRDGIPLLESIIQEGRRPSDAERDRHELLQALKAERKLVEDDLHYQLMAQDERIRELEAKRDELERKYIIALRTLKKALADD